MIISAPVLRYTSDECILSSVITLRSRRRVRLWFAVDRSLRTNIRISSDVFLLAMVLTAMKLGEEISVSGSVSRVLLDALPGYQRLFQSWFPKDLTVVPIHANARMTVLPRGSGSLTVFSGGVDSFYTLYRCVTKKTDPLTHALYVHGFDVPLTNTAGFRYASRGYASMLTPLGVRLLTVRTNLKQITDRYVRWEWSHGCALAAVTHIFAPIVSTAYIPGTFSRDEQIPWGSHPQADPMLSTEQITIVHHGSDKTRIQKIQKIHTLPYTYDHLRVCCWLEGNTLMNCSRCSKCIRTMIPLRILGVLGKYSLFPLPLDRRSIRRLPIAYRSCFIFMKSTAGFAESRGETEMARDIRYALVKNYLFMHAIQFSSRSELIRKVLASHAMRAVYYRIIGRASPV